MVFRLDDKGVFLDYKAEFEDLYAQSIPSIIGCRCRDILELKFARRVERYIRRSLESRRPHMFEYQLLIPGKGVRDYEAHMVASGRNEVIVIVRDITEQKDMALALRKEKDLRSTIVDASIDGILVVDVEGTVVSCNRQFTKIWGIPDEVLGTRRDERLLEEVRERLAEPEHFTEKVKWLYDHAHKTSRDEIHLADGRVLDRYSAPAIGKDGEYYGRIWYFRDMTERKELENELKAHRDHLGCLVAERTAEIELEVMKRTRKEEQYLSLIESIIEWVWEVDTHFIHT
jgi:PAS domain S-box-containing protein